MKLGLSIQLMKLENLGAWKKEYLTLSCGAVALVPLRKLAPPLLFENAKEALRQATASGRNRVVALKNEKGQIVKTKK